MFSNFLNNKFCCWFLWIQLDIKKIMHCERDIKFNQIQQINLLLSETLK